MLPTARLHLRIGARLVAEPIASDSADMAQLLVALRQHDAVDGGLELQYGPQVLCHSHIWDRLDGLLLAWLTGLRAIADGAESAVVTFPDTRIECELSRGSADTVHVAYEDVDAAIPLVLLVRAIEQAAGRLVATVSDVGALTSDLRQLGALLGTPTALSPNTTRGNPGAMR